MFISFGIALLLPTWFVLRPEVVAPTFVGLLGLGLLIVAVLEPERRWVFIPAAVLGAVATIELVAGVSVFPADAAPFFVPVVLLVVGAFVLVDRRG